MLPNCGLIGHDITAMFLTSLVGMRNEDSDVDIEIDQPWMTKSSV